MKFSVGSTTYKWFGRTLDGPLFIRDLEHPTKFEEATKKEAIKRQPVLRLRLVVSLPRLHVLHATPAVHIA